MATPVTMPQLGESVVEGTVLRWLKAEGDRVEADEPLVEVSTEKVDTEIPSPVAGVLVKILVQEGETVEVGTPLCEVDESGAGAATTTQEPEATPKAAEEKAPPTPEAPPAPVPAAARAPQGDGDGQAGVLSPLVRRLAREQGVDLSRVRGTGAGGRVTKQDVLNAAAAAPSQAPAGDRDEAVALTHIRKRIAEHMVHSLQTSARAWNAVEIDVENVARLRAAVNEDFKRREGFSLTYLPFIARAIVDALAAFPVANASISEDGAQVVYHHYVNLGVAVATDYGLIVPVVKGAEAMNVVGLARAIRQLAEKARSKSLLPDEVTGSTFTITNPGPFGSQLSVPIINQPNSAILSTEAVEKRVVVIDDMIAIRHRMFCCLSWDHRLLDGSDAMQFLARLKENLETWDFTSEVHQP